VCYHFYRLVAGLWQAMAKQIKWNLAEGLNLNSVSIVGTCTKVIGPFPGRSCLYGSFIVAVRSAIDNKTRTGSFVCRVMGVNAKILRQMTPGDIVAVNGLLHQKAFFKDRGECIVQTYIVAKDISLIHPGFNNLMQGVPSGRRYEIDRDVEIGRSQLSPDIVATEREIMSNTEAYKREERL